MEPAMIILGAIILMVSAVADSIRDKRADHVVYPGYHKRYRKFKPYWLWRKLQNKWHVWKQVSYMLPAAYIWMVVTVMCYSIAPTIGVLAGIGLPLAVFGLWGIVSDPVWWD